MSTQGTCLACQALGKICSSDCILAPLFPVDQPQRFAVIHDVYDCNNIAKILQGLPPQERSVAVQTLVFEAECRLQDPIYGVTGRIYSCRQEIEQIETQLCHAQRELEQIETLLRHPQRELEQTQGLQEQQQGQGNQGSRNGDDSPGQGDQGSQNGDDFE